MAGPFASVCMVTGVRRERSAERTPILRQVADALLCDAGHPHELILVDNGETDEHRAEVERMFATNPRITHLVTNRHNLTLAAGLRQAFALADGEHLVNMDDDVVVRPGWLRALLAPLLERPEEKWIGALCRFSLHSQSLGTVMVGGHKYTLTTRAAGCLWAQRRETIEELGPLFVGLRWDTRHASRAKKHDYRFVFPTPGDRPPFARLAAQTRALYGRALPIDVAAWKADYLAHLDAGGAAEAHDWPGGRTNDKACLDRRT